MAGPGPRHDYSEDVNIRGKEVILIYVFWSGENDCRKLKTKTG